MKNFTYKMSCFIFFCNPLLIWCMEQQRAYTPLFPEQRVVQYNPAPHNNIHYNITQQPVYYVQRPYNGSAQKPAYNMVQQSLPSASSAIAPIIAPTYLTQNQLHQKTIEQFSQELTKKYTNTTSVFFGHQWSQSKEIMLEVAKQNFTLEQIKMLSRKNQLFKLTVTHIKKKIFNTLTTYPYTWSLDSLLEPVNDYPFMKGALATYLMQKAYNTQPFDYKIVLPCSADIICYDFLPEKNLFLSLDKNKKLLLWDLTTGSSSLLKIIVENYVFLELSDDGEHTVIGTKTDIFQPFSFEIFNNKCKRIEHCWDGNDLPNYVRDISYVSPEHIIVKGNKRSKDDFKAKNLYKYHLTKGSSKGTNRTLAVTDYSNESDGVDSKALYFSNEKNVLIPQKSSPVFLLTNFIECTRKEKYFDPLKNTPEYKGLNPLQKAFIDELIETKKNSIKPFLSFSSNPFSTPEREMEKAYCILK